MTECKINAVVENAADGQGWLATIHLPAYPIMTGGPPMDAPQVLKIIQHTVRGFFTICARQGVDDGTPADSVINVDVEFKKS